LVDRRRNHRLSAAGDQPGRRNRRQQDEFDRRASSGEGLSGTATKAVSNLDGRQFAIRPGGARGLGDVIGKADDPRLLDGVRIFPLSLWPDDRGYFMEVARLGQGAAEHLGVSPSTVQVSATLSYPGTIKALHYHCRQTDLWSPVAGMFQVCLYDLRVESPTFGRTNTIYLGHLRPWELRIPPGVAHGYKVLSSDPAVLVYITDRLYDPSDEGRLPYNDPDVNYDWDLQHK
jgi:dTDP-4-dehydrorhamnose 3,5-epimerase